MNLDADTRAMLFPVLIERWECPKHGQSTAVRADGCGLCHPSRPLEPVLRRYVSLDALCDEPRLHTLHETLTGAEPTLAELERLRDAVRIAAETVTRPADEERGR